MGRFIYIASQDYQESLNEYGLKNGKKNQQKNMYGVTTGGNYIIPHQGRIDTVRSSVEQYIKDKAKETNGNEPDKKNIQASLANLVEQLKTNYPGFDWSSNGVNKILIHFGGEDANECKTITELLSDGCTVGNKHYNFESVSRKNSYPSDYFKDGELSFPDDPYTPSEEKGGGSSNLVHLERFYRQIQIIESDKDFFEKRYLKYDFWIVAIWDGEKPESFEAAFTKDEHELLSDDKNKELNDFFAKVIKGPEMPNDTNQNNISLLADEEKKLLDKIISQIMRIFIPQKSVRYTPPPPCYKEISFSPFGQNMTIACFALLFLTLMVVPTCRHFFPGEAEYETEMTIRIPPSLFPHQVLRDDSSDSKQEQPAKQMTGKEDADSSDSSCFEIKTSRKAAPIQYFHIILLFLLYAVGGVLCFVICLKYLHAHSRKEKIAQQDAYFSNLSRIMLNLNSNDRQAVVKQFAHSATRLFFNGDDVE